MKPAPFMLAFTLLLAAPAHAADAAVYLVVRNSPLAGFRYNDGRLLWNEIRVGDTLALVREPDNPFDASAIRLEWNGRKIGYVPRRENNDLARQLDNGTTVEAHITELAKIRNGRHSISYDILVPLRTVHDAQATAE